MYARKALALAVLALIAPSAMAQVIYVDDDASTNGNGETWATAFKYLQDGIRVASVGEIHVAGGTYRPDQDEFGAQIPGDRESRFSLLDGVAIRGGYRGCPGGNCLGGDPDERNITLYESILDGDLAGNDLTTNGPDMNSNGDNCYHVVVGSGANDTAVLDGFTIRGGNASGSTGWPDYNGCGGGLRVHFFDVDPPTLTNPTITACTFRENYGVEGAGAWVREAGITLSDCTFEDNSGGYGTGASIHSTTGSITGCRLAHNVVAPYHSRGGALSMSADCTVQVTDTTFIENAMYGVQVSNNITPEFTECHFIGNTYSGVKIVGAHPTFSACTFQANQSMNFGGGLYVDGGGATMTDCGFLENGAQQSGGGMWVRSADVELTNCTIQGNTATTGAGMYIDYGQTTVIATGCEIISNNATGGVGAIGGGMYIHGDVTADFEKCLIAGNTAYTGAGGYIYSWGSAGSIPVSFVSCLFAGNVATTEAGALYANRYIDLTLTNCTLVNNDGAAARALYCASHNNSYPSTVSITNCIVRNGGDEILNDDASTISIRYSDITGGWGGPTDYNIGSDPLFVDEDGPDDDPGTWDDNNWHLLREFSPCIDAGSNGAIANINDTSTNALPQTDFDGWPRFQDDTQAPDCPLGGECGVPPVVDMGAFEVWTDCNDNGVADVCEVNLNCDTLWPCDPADCDIAVDCNTNDIPDECDIAADSSLDCDDNGQIDDCEIADDPSLDCDSNGMIDFCDITTNGALDCDGNSQIDSCEIAADPSLDCDYNSELDECDILNNPALDCDGNGEIDSCEIAADPSLDCDYSGELDECDLLNYPDLDCDESGAIDSCEIADDPSLDCNYNYVIDFCDIITGAARDCDWNLRIDFCEIVADPSLDCDYNGELDECDIIANPDLDCDNSGRIDDCEIADDPNLDCDSNGVIDFCDITTNATLDCDSNGEIDTCEIADDPDLDCNNNGMLDECDIATGHSWDVNTDGLPDECQPCVASAWDVLVAPLGAAGESLGSTVASDGDWLFIGAPTASVSGMAAAGRVLVARRTGARWTVVDELTATASVEAGAGFGTAVALRGNVAAVGAPFSGVSGAVYVYRLNEVLDVWQHEDTLDGSMHLSAVAAFGASVAVDGDYLVAGAPGDDTGTNGSAIDAGSAIVFEYDPIAGQWNTGTLLLPPEAGTGDFAGYGVAVSGDVVPPYVVVGAPLEDGSGDTTSDMGAVYRWEKMAGTWTLDPTIYRLDDGDVDDAFGVDVAAVGAEFFAGAPGHLNSSLTRGAVAVFGPDPARIEAPAGDLVGFGRLIDVRLDAQGERLAIASPQDPSPDSRVYLYEKRAAGWTELVQVGQELHQAWFPDTKSITLGADVLFVGDELSDAACGSCGAVFAYSSLGDCNANNWIDLCEIATGAAADCNRTGTPDSCELIRDFDFDADRDVDLDDYAALADALAGPGVPPDPDDPICVDVYLDAFDVEPDGDLDLRDFAAFQAAFLQPPGMVLVPAGEFEMGDSFNEGDANELPVHAVYLSEYWIDRYEVTNALYAAALNWAYAQGDLITVTDGRVYQFGTGTEFPYCLTTGDNPYLEITWNGGAFGVVTGKESHPMGHVTWYGAMAFCNWRSVMEGKPPCCDLSTWTCEFGTPGYRLPTEAEWEKAAAWDPVLQRHFRFGEHTDGCGYSCLDGQRANYAGSGDPYGMSDTRITPVGFYNGRLHFKADFGWPGSAESYQTQNAHSYYGCYDMTGNTSEFCYDRYDPAYYDSGAFDNPTGPISGSLRVRRGGNPIAAPLLCRSAGRAWYNPLFSASTVGFRCALGTP